MPLDNENNTQQASASTDTTSTTTSTTQTTDTSPPPAVATPASPSAVSSQASAAAAPGASGGETKPPPKPGDPGVDKKPLLDKIKAVLGNKGEQKPAATTTQAPAQQQAAQGQGQGQQTGQQQQQQQQTPQQTAAELLGKIPDAEWKNVPEITRRRITAFRQAVREQGTKLQHAAPRAQAYDNLMGWVETQKMSQEDFSFGLELIAAVRKDPARAWQSIQPIVGYLRQTLGEELPADIQERLTKGEISEAAAKEMARTRASAKLGDERLREEREETSRREAAAQEVRSRTNLTNAIASWENTWKTRDPDYKAKWPRVWDRILTIIQTEHPGGVQKLTQQNVVQIAERAKKDVETWMADVTPRTALREVRTITGSASGNAKPAPKSVLDVVKQTYAGAGSR